MSDNLTFADLLKTKDLIFPPLYYATMEGCEIGKVYHIVAGPRNPEYIVFNPLDFDKISQDVSSSRRLVHLRDYKLTRPNKASHWNDQSRFLSVNSIVRGIK